MKINNSVKYKLDTLSFQITLLIISGKWVNPLQSLHNFGIRFNHEELEKFEDEEWLPLDRLVRYIPNHFADLPVTYDAQNKNTLTERNGRWRFSTVLQAAIVMQSTHNDVKQKPVLYARVAESFSPNEVETSIVGPFDLKNVIFSKKYQPN